MQFNEKVHEIFLLGKVATVAKVWFQPSGQPIENLSVAVHSKGVPMPGGFTVDWDIMYGGNWLTGTPYSDTATHSGGRVISSGSFAAGAEVAEIIYNGAPIFPTNSRRTVYNADGSPNRKGWGGFPLLARFTNNTIDDVTLVVTFLTKSLSIS
jgi:hypothetical protein